jgi:hypothetical protein
VVGYFWVVAAQVAKSYKACQRRPQSGFEDQMESSMLKLRTQNGRTIQAHDARGIVAALRTGSHSPGDSVRTFMLEVASRASAQTGKTINGESAHDLVAGLIGVGLLESVD